MQATALIECPAGTAAINGATAYYVQSPRTGKRLYVSRDELAKVNDRLLGRIAQARASARRLVSFSREELRAIAAAVNPQPVPAPKPTPEPAEPDHARRSFWNGPAMSKAKPVATETTVDTSDAQDAPNEDGALIGEIRDNSYVQGSKDRLCIILPHRSGYIVGLDDRHWHRLPEELADRVRASALNGRSLPLSPAEVDAVNAIACEVRNATFGRTPRKWGN